MPLQRRYTTLVGCACVLWLSACQLISGLGDLRSEGDGAVSASSSAGSASSSSGAGLGGGSASGGGGAVNGGGGGGGGDGPFPCAEYVVKDLTTPVDRLVITPDKSTLVWTSDPAKGDAGDRSIMRVPTSGGKPTIVVPGGNLKEVHQLAASSINVFWLTGQETDADLNPAWHGNVAPLSAPGGVALFIEEFAPIQALAVTDLSMYWTVPAEGRMAVKSSMSVATPMFSGLPTQIEGADSLLATGGLIYWRRKMSPGGSDEAIMYTSDVAPMAPAQSAIYELVKTSDASDFIIQGSYVYWTQGDPQNGSINRGTISLGKVTKSLVLIDGLSFPTHLSVGSSSTHWAEGASSDCSDVVKRFNESSGNVMIQTMSRGERCVSNFVEDNLYVYWGSGTMICKSPL